MLKVRKRKSAPQSLDEVLNATENAFLFEGVKASNSSVSNKNDLTRGLEDIEAFILEHNSLPSADSSEFQEKMLGYRLQAVKNNYPDRFAALNALLTVDHDSESMTVAELPDPYQHAEPVPPPRKQYSSLDEIFSDSDALDDLFGDVDADDTADDSWLYAGIQQPVASTKKRQMSDIAQVVACPDFDQTYKSLFERCNQLIASKDLIRKRLKGYNTGILKPGRFFVNKRVTALVAACAYEQEIQSSRKSNFRIKVVYENGTQSEPLNRSFIEVINKDEQGSFITYDTPLGKAFLESIETLMGFMSKDWESGTGAGAAASTGGAGGDPTEASGYLYILRSLSTNSVLHRFMQNSDLVKIGFSTTTVEERIKNAAHEPTYLCAPVDVIRVYRCHDIDPHKFEQAVHMILGTQRLNVTLTDSSGKKYRPREWFTVSAQTACEVADHILDGTIMQYRIDPVMGRLVKR